MKKETARAIQEKAMLIREVAKEMCQDAIVGEEDIILIKIEKIIDTLGDMIILIEPEAIEIMKEYEQAVRRGGLK